MSLRPARAPGRRWRALVLGAGVVASVVAPVAAPAAPPVTPPVAPPVAPPTATATGGACPAPLAPVTFARRLFERHRDFYWDEAHHDPAWLTPRFDAALRREWAYAKGEVGHLDVDPWLGAQDGDIGAPVTFRLLAGQGGVSTVLMRYPFLTEPGARPQRHTVRLLLRRAAGGCWQLDDLITPAGQSLRTLYAPAETAVRP